jgi:hypothetical protein
MNQNGDNGLPYYARGMDFDKFAWEVRPDGKVHLIAKNAGGFHWTFHPGPRTGALDLHETSVNPDGTKSYETLFMIKIEDFERLANEIAPLMISGLLQQFRPLSLKWVRRRNISIVRDPSSTNAELAAVTYKSHKRLQFDTQKLAEALDTATSPGAVPFMKDGWFRMMSIRRWGTRCIGVGIKATDRSGATHLVWARLEELVGWGEEMQLFLMDAATKYLIPKEDYPKYLKL